MFSHLRRENDTETYFVGVKEIYELGRIVLDVIVAEVLNGNYLFLVVKKHITFLYFHTILASFYC